MALDKVRYVVRVMLNEVGRDIHEGAPSSVQFDPHSIVDRFCRAKRELT